MNKYITNTKPTNEINNVLVYNNEIATTQPDAVDKIVLAYQLGIPEDFISLNPEFFDQRELYMAKNTPKKDGSGGGKGNTGRGGCTNPKGGRQGQGSGYGGGKNQGSGRGRNR